MNALQRNDMAADAILANDKTPVGGFSFYVDLHVVVKGNLSVRQGHEIAHQVESTVLEEVAQISEVLVHIEPEEELLNQTDESASGIHIR